MTKINRFVRKLAHQSTGERAANFYQYGSKDSPRKRKNLRIYLEAMLAAQPEVLLVGEAPGYRGCKQTGIPFSSERLVAEGQFPYGKSMGYKLGKTEKLYSESSATILWQALWELEMAPLCWNAFPFHPYVENNPDSNRKPNKEELEIGQYFLKRLIRLFRVKTVVAVGKSAERSLGMAGVGCVVVRHPSYGGKRDFCEGMAGLFGQH